MKPLQERIEEAAAYIQSKTKYSPKIGIILGSGLGDYGDTLENAEYYPYEEIPHFPVSTVEGHKGRFVVTDQVICMQGRFHFYEGYAMEQVTFPIRVMRLLGVEKLLLTNAAGGVNTTFRPGNLMVITDHINYMGTNPLIGPNLDRFGLRFPDMSKCYPQEYVDMIYELGKEIGLTMQKGVYLGYMGPSFETPAEIRAFRILGADAVGMSTVPEAIVANHCGMKVMGISCITNLAAGVTDQPLSHIEVMETAELVKPKFIALVKQIVERLHEA